MHLQTSAEDNKGNETIVITAFTDSECSFLLANEQEIAPAISRVRGRNLSVEIGDRQESCEQYEDSHNDGLTSTDLLLRINVPRVEPLPSLPSSKDLENKSIAMMISIKEPVETNATLHYYAPDHITESPGDGQQRPLRPFTMYEPKEFLKSRYLFALRHPNLRLEVLDAISKINQTSGRATVWLTCRLSHYSIADMKAKESVVMLSWRCLESYGWVCIKTSFIHGPGYFA